MQKTINTILRFFSVIIAVIGLLNLPNFAVATRGSGTILSYIMLGPSLIMAIYFSLKRSFDANNSLLLLLTTIFSYLIIGVANMFIWDESELTSGGRKVTEDWTYILRVMLQTTLVMFASYKYVLFSHSQGRMHKYINLLIGIAVFGALITILSPFLGFYRPGFFQAGYKNTSSLTRPAGFYMNPNSAGYHAVVTLLLVVSVLFRTKSSRILVFLMI